MRLNKNLLAMAIAVAASGNIAAYEAGDWIVRAGYAAVDPRDSSTDLKVEGTEVGNTGVGVDGAAALGITVSYMFTPHWGIEVLASTPFEHDITTKGLGGLGVGDGTVLGSAKHLPPTVSAQYYFLDKGPVQPYVGIGINYTLFFDESVSADAKTALGASNLNLDDSMGLAAAAGVDWLVGEHWLINASVWRMQLETDASVDTALGRVKTTVSVDPWVYMVAVGYKF